MREDRQDVILMKLVGLANDGCATGQIVQAWIQGRNDGIQISRAAYSDDKIVHLFHEETMIHVHPDHLQAITVSPPQ